MKANFIKTLTSLILITFFFLSLKPVLAQKEAVYFDKNSKILFVNNFLVENSIEIREDTIREIRFFPGYKKHETVIDVQGTCNFDRCVFQNLVNFAKFRFSNHVSFNCQFSDDVSFNSSWFLKQVSFNGSKFLKRVTFRNSVFSKNAEFSDTKFSNDADFQNVQFLDFTTFHGAEFLSSADFKDAQFQNYTDFTITQFSNIAVFQSIILSDSSKLNFENCILPDTIDFSYVSKIFNDIDLSSANFIDSPGFDSLSGNQKTHFISLFKSKISRFHIDYIHFLPIINQTLKHFNIPIPQDESQAIYEQMLSNFRDRGQLESYKLCDIEYQKFKWKIKPWYLSWIGWLNQYWWNFGYNKELIFRAIFIFIILFTFINFFLLHYLNQKVYHLDNIPQVPKWQVGRRLWFSFAYTSGVFFRLTLNTEKLNYEKVLGTIYLLIMYASGLVCLGYLANFIIQK